MLQLVSVGVSGKPDGVETPTVAPAARREAFLSEAQRRLGPSADAAALGEMAEEMGRKWLDAEPWPKM